MDEAGTLRRSKVPAILKWAVFLVLAATIAFASYADGGGGWEIALLVHRDGHQYLFGKYDDHTDYGSQSSYFIVMFSCCGSSGGCRFVK